VSITRHDGKKPAGGAESVRALEAMVIALQADIKSFKGTRGGTINLDKQHLKCSNQSCRKVGHLIADCFQAGGGKAGQYPHWWKGKRIVIFTGNLGVFQGYPYPYPSKPVPATKGRGFGGSG